MNREVKFLIVGLARSGTTLCQRLAAEIRGVWVPRETHYWSRYLLADRQFAERRLSYGAIEALVGRMQQPREPIALTEREAASILTRVGSTGCSPWELFCRVVDSMSPPGRQTLGEKTPAHAAIASRLLAEQSALKVVGVVRDPRAVFASHLATEWGLRESQRLAWRWRLLYERLLADVDQFGGRMLLVRYEDVVADSTGFQMKLAEFLGVPLETSPVEDQLFPEHESWKHRALHSPDRNRIAAWREALSVHDVAAIEHVTAPVAGIFGYSRSQPSGACPLIDSGSYLRERRAAARFDVD